MHYQTVFLLQCLHVLHVVRSKLAIGSLSIANFRDLFIKSNPTSLAGSYVLRVDSVGRLQMFIFNSSSSSVYIGKYSLNSLSLYNWSLVTVTYNGSQTKDSILIYINGVNQSLNDVVGTANNISGMASTNMPVYIGARLDGTPEYTNGSIDDVIIWSRALNATEINTIYNEGLAGRTINDTAFADYVYPANTNLVSYWSFDNDDATTAIDQMGLNNAS